MGKNLKPLLVVWLSLGIFHQIQAQKIDNINPTIVGKEIIITYDLKGESPDALCEVKIFFGSKLNQSQLLTDATGDIGKDIKVGKLKKIQISNIEPFLPFKSQLTFRAEPKYTFLPISDFSNIGTTEFKKGGNIPLKWKGGVKDASLTFDLYKEDMPIANGSFTLKNQNKYNYKIPNNLKKGAGYEIKLSDDSGKIFNSGKFSLKPAVGLPIKIVISAVAVGSIIYFLTKDGSSSETQTVPELPTDIHPGG